MQQIVNLGRRLNYLALLALGFASALSAATPPGKPFVHGLFSDHMVLQRDAECPVWGWTEPGGTVSVRLNEEPAIAATAGPDGRWQATVGPKPAGTLTTLTVSGPQTVTLKDVLFGDVWVCSGQSNMEMGINGVDQWWNELPGAPVPDIRLFYVLPVSSFTVAPTVTGRWSVASGDELLNKKKPHTTVGFSAIAWFFGRAVQKQAGVPVGLIESAQGNTAIDPWSTLESLRQMPRYSAALEPRKHYEEQLTEGWRERDPGYAESAPWRQPEFDDASWAVLDLPQEWHKSELGGFTGFVWFRRRIDLPVDWAGRELLLELGPIEDQDAAWVNGVFVGGQDGMRRHRVYTVPSGVVRAGMNVIAVRVLGSRGFIGKPEQLQLGLADGSAPPVPLAGTWKYRAGTPKAKLTGRKRQYDAVWIPAGLYNGMIAALAPFAIKGVIWYQGEGNVGYSGTYADELARLVRDWRATFGQGDFPFYIVQLAGFGPLPEAPPAGSGWAAVRAAQAQVGETVPHCASAVAIDRGEIGNIHPPNKREVGERLAAAALARTYGLDVPYRGPTCRAMQVEGERIRVTFDHGTGLKSLGSAPAGFAIAGADKRFVWAQAIVDGESVLVSAPEVKAPVAVRYGWADNALCNLYNRDNFPAVPFRTDSW